MSNDRTRIHALLDGDLPAAERERLARDIQDDPVLRKELDGLAAATDLLELHGRVQPPPRFTAAVMDRLSRRPAPLRALLREFLFGSRVLRWNMASALGLIAASAVAIVMMMQMSRPGTDRTADGPAGTATVRLTFVAPAAQQVAVAGDFNKWRTTTHAMRREHGMWTIELPLPPGRYVYMFVVDGSMWITDPHADGYSDDGFGNRNAVMQVSI